MKTDNLIQKEALVKLKSMAEAIKITMMLTNLKKQPISVNPMSTKRVDEDGAIWFLSPLKSEHNVNIQSDNKVQLIYSDPQNKQYLSVFGDAWIESRYPIKKELYTKEDDIWFDGVDDVNLTAIKVNPQQAFYWDKSSNKFINMFEETVEALTGEAKDHFKKGKLEVD
jgi:general stress protein 26